MERVVAFEPAYVFIGTPLVNTITVRDIWASQQISQYINAPIRIMRRESTRPSLAPPHEELGISIAKTGGILAIAVDIHAPIGIDIEPTSAALGMSDLAKDHFNTQEINAIFALPQLQRDDASLKLWVMKEAVLKLTGRGVYDGMLQPNTAHIIKYLVNNSCRDFLNFYFPVNDKTAHKCSIREVFYHSKKYYIALAQTAQL